MPLASAIPFAGWGATAAKAGRKVAKASGEAGAKAAKEAAEKAAKEKAEKEAAEKAAKEKGGKVKGKGAGPCDHLRQGNGKGPYRGGAHSKTSKPANDDKDSHHMPADDVSPLSRNDGPAIQMDPSDHRMSKSNGSQPGSAKYRAALEALIQNGQWREAMTNEIKDIRRIQDAIDKPGKYNEAMLEMLEYFKCLETHGLLPEG